MHDIGDAVCLVQPRFLGDQQGLQLADDLDLLLQREVGDDLVEVRDAGVLQAGQQVRDGDEHPILCIGQVAKLGQRGVIRAGYLDLLGNRLDAPSQLVDVIVAGLVEIVIRLRCQRARF